MPFQPEMKDEQEAVHRNHVGPTPELPQSGEAADQLYTYLQGLLMELAGLEPAASWVRFGRPLRANSANLQGI